MSFADFSVQIQEENLDTRCSLASEGRTAPPALPPQEIWVPPEGGLAAGHWPERHMFGPQISVTGSENPSWKRTSLAFYKGQVQ